MEKMVREKGEMASEMAPEMETAGEMAPEMESEGITQEFDEPTEIEEISPDGTTT